MTTGLKIEPVVKKLTVPRDAQTAFEYYTAEVNSWWPRNTHSLGLDKTVKIVMEPGVGGRFYEVQEDGTELLWGTVELWEPGKLLKYTWHLSRPPEKATHVELRFDDQGDGTTLVTLTHTNWEVLAEDAPAAREGYNNGWELVFHQRFGEFAKTGEPLPPN